MFAGSPSTIMEAAFGRLHNGGPAAFGRRPTVVDIHYGEYGGLKDKKNIGKWVSNIYGVAHFANFPIIPIKELSSCLMHLHVLIHAQLVKIRLK